jgi:type VI secretion system secreted protein Hcp
MFMKRIIYLALFSAPLLFCNNSYGQGTTAQLRIDNIQGESILSGHVNEIDILSYSNGISSCNQVSSGSTKTSSCKPIASEMSFMMVLNRATMQLKSAITTGKIIPSADFTYIFLGGATPFEYYKVHMENINVVSVQESGSSEKPTVSLSLAFSRIAWKYTMQDPNTGGPGEVTTGGWDFVGAKAFNYY